MTAEFDAITSSLIHEVHLKLTEATGIAKAANGLAESGNVKHALQILMDFEGPAYEAQQLFKAALAIKRTLLSESH